MGEGIAKPGDAGFSLSANEHRRDAKQSGVMPSKYRSAFIRAKTIDEIKARMPLNYFSGDLIDCPLCYTDLWCIEFDRQYACVDMQCYKCGQVWYDIPFDAVDKWFRRKMWKDYKLFDSLVVNIWAYAYFWRPKYKRKIRVLNHTPEDKYSKKH